MGKDKIQLLNQALNAASSSLNLAKQLISEIEHHSGTPEMPGLVGKYDGMFMVTEAGKKYPVPDNYSAKTKLVYGDKLKMVEGPEGRRFKLLEEMEREEQEAQLAVKDGHFEALSKDSSYRLIQGAVRYWSGEEGDKLKILLPKGQRNVPFAGLVEIIGRKPGEGVTEEPKPQVASRPPSQAPVLRAREERPPEPKAPEKPAQGEARSERPSERPSAPVRKATPAKPIKKEEEKSVRKDPDNRAPARLLGSRNEPSKEEKKEEPAKDKKEDPAKLNAAKSASGGKTSKPIDEEELR